MAEQSPSNRLSREDATEVLLEILFTGASSVTTTLSWLLWHLATHPDPQARVVQECCAINLKSLLSSSPPKMMFLEACIRETLRLYSPIHVGRHCIEDDQFGDVSIPKGTDVAANMWFIHRSSEYWPDPSHFNPERWMDKPTNVAFYHPFSMGMRGCPGKAVAYTMIKYSVVRILTCVELEPMPNKPSPSFSGSVVLSNTPINIYLNGKLRRNIA
jgi:cytochrome P450